MLTARQKVLAHLNKFRAASPREIARALDMAVPTVRHHLRILAGDGRLEVTSGRGRDGGGRPEKVYSLPSAALGDNLSKLSDALLEGMAARFEPEYLATRLAGESDPKVQPLPKRLNLTVAKLNAMNYHSRWEAGSAGPRIIFGHCPYAAIIAKHPELCRMDSALLERLMGQPAGQFSKIGVEGSSVCVFLIGA